MSYSYLQIILLTYSSFLSSSVHAAVEAVRSSEGGDVGVRTTFSVFSDSSITSSTSSTPCSVLARPVHDRYSYQSQHFHLQIAPYEYQKLLLSVQQNIKC